MRMKNGGGVSGREIIVYTLCYLYDINVEIRRIEKALADGFKSHGANRKAEGIPVEGVTLSRLEAVKISQSLDSRRNFLDEAYKLLPEAESTAMVARELISEAEEFLSSLPGAQTIERPTLLVEVLAD